MDTGKAGRVVIIDNGGANTASLQFALARLQCDTHVTTDANLIRTATHVILPGVGAAADSMRRLRARGLDGVIGELEQPLLGICLGMQLLYEVSEEGGSECLGLIPGTVRRLAAVPGRPVPHTGWNNVSVTADSQLLREVHSGSRLYFVHSYAIPVGPETVACTEYGETFSSVVSFRNFHGTQFHPERSGKVGAQVLSNFLRLN